jgi:cell wall-associated protease
MKKLLLPLLLFTLHAQAATYIVEMKRPLKNAEIATAKKNGLRIELFDHTKTDYFKRTYRIDAQDDQYIKLSLPALLIESVTYGLITGLEPKKGSSFIRPDELFQYQWGLYNQGQTVSKAIGTTKLLTMKGSPGIDIRWKDAIQKIEAGLVKTPVVAVIDMGIDFDHPDLKGRIFKNEIECDEKGEITDRDEDRDNNGLKGDCMGWNFTARTMGEARRPIDDNGHGTHVSGIIAAQTNKIGVSGVSSKIKILPIKVTGAIDESSDRKTIAPLTDRVAKGILYAANMGADVINLSLGWTRSMDTKYLNEAIKFAQGRGVIIVAAAGNNNNNASILPCSYYDVICVGSASVDGSLSDFSNYGGEVDIIAPGDEIISTIPLNTVPLQLNLQGYDVRSGTSQATPFVSAAAALVRGTFPNLHRDEVTQKLLDSADNSRLGESMSGMLNLKGAFEIAPSPSIKPVFKNFATALYDAPSRKFNFTLPVKNFSQGAKNIKIIVTSLNPGLALNQTFTFEVLRPGEIVTARLDGEITDMNQHNIAKIQVKVEADGVSSKSYQHEFRLARDILKDNNISTLPFTFANAALPVGTFVDNEAKNLINTVEVPHSSPEFPEFYLPRNVKEPLSMEIRIFKKNADTFSELPAFMALPGALQLLNVTKLDLNFDGEEDYLVRALACEKDCNDPAKASRYLQYSLWKKDLTPLFEGKNIWKFLPTLVNVDIKSQRFYKLETKEFGPVAVPMFVETSVIPTEQQELQDSFSLPDRSASRRVYFLSPQKDNEGKINLVTKTISTNSFLNAIRSSTESDPEEEIQAMHLLAQSKNDVMSGSVTAIFAVGKGFVKKNILLKMGAKVAPENFSITQNLWGYEHFSSQNLNNDSFKNSFVGLVSKSRLVMIQTGLSKAFSYNSANTPEAPLGAVASFTDEQTDYTFFQTPSYLMLAMNNGQETTFRKLKINRFSFLPGTLFNDSFYPVQIRRDDKNYPALYVDETDIQNDIVSLTLFDGENLRSPIGTSSFVPPICKAMNPVRLVKESGYSMSLLCLENKQWVMKFKEMK